MLTEALGLPCRSEYVDGAEGLFSVDILADAPDGRRVAVEADGPSHFTSNGRLFQSPTTVPALVARKGARAGGCFLPPLHVWSLGLLFQHASDVALFGVTSGVT